jgi:hypothetical protein
MILTSQSRPEISVALHNDNEVFVLTDKELDCPCITIEDDFNTAILASILEDDIPPAYPFIVAFNDMSRQEHVCNILQLHKIDYVEATYVGFDYAENKNKVLVLIPAEAKLREFALAAHVHETLKKVEKGVDLTSTGFTNLDQTLGGGLHNGRLYVLGAIPSLGKTTLSLNIADNLARKGVDVLLFSLEMMRQELIIKLLIRHATINARGENRNVPTYKDLLNKSLSSEKAESLLQASAEFCKGAGNKIAVVAGFGKSGLKEIADTVKLYTDCNRKPVVMIDFLQIMNPPLNAEGKLSAGSDKQIMDKNLAGLKTLAIDNDIPVWAISSLNRLSYLNEVSFESFKETGGIETWADVVLGMHLYVPQRKEAGWDKVGLVDKRRILDEAKMASPRRIQVQTLKNRSYEFGLSAYFNYYPRYDAFTEAAEPLEEI